MLSQSGSGSSRALTALPTAPDFGLSSSCFRVVLLRRLWLPMPIGPWRCGGALDTLGDRTACPTAGVLGTHGAGLERAGARVCREAGARVASNVFLRDMNVDVPLADGRRIEVLAVDTTLVSPLARYAGGRRATTCRSCPQHCAESGGETQTPAHIPGR